MRKHKTALITGASGGLGLEFAKILAKKKYNLVLIAKSSRDESVIFLSELMEHIGKKLRDF